jgi:hypothetical protein
MRKALLLPLLLFLSGCSETRDREVAACRLEAMKTYPNESGPYSLNMDAFIETCMESKGYRFNVHPEDCGHGDLHEDPACYEWRGPFSN